MVINYSDLSDTKNYKLMSQTIIPRPIAWIVTPHNGIVEKLNMEIDNICRIGKRFGKVKLTEL